MQMKVRIQRNELWKCFTAEVINLGYVHTKSDKFENATFAPKTDKMFSVHINRFQTVSLCTLKRCLSPRTVARLCTKLSHHALVLPGLVQNLRSKYGLTRQARLIRAPNTQCFDVYEEVLHKDCIAQRLSPNRHNNITNNSSAISDQWLRRDCNRVTWLF